MLLSTGCGNSATDVIEEFVAESGLAFEECGSGARCEAVGQCLISSFERCTPARGQLDDGTYFVVPNGARCKVVLFTETSSDTLERRECESFSNPENACAYLDTCTTTNRWHF